MRERSCRSSGGASAGLAAAEQHAGTEGYLRQHGIKSIDEHNLGVVKIRQGDFGYAASALQRTLALADTFGLQLPKGQALLGLSELAMANGDPGHASQHAQQAADIFRGIGAPLCEVRATRLVGQAREFSAKKRH